MSETVRKEGIDALSPEWLRAQASAPRVMPPGDIAFVTIAAPLCEMPADALEIADESSECLIESDSRPTDIDGVRWWDTSYATPDAGMEQALRYLESRGLLIRHAEDGHLVRVST